LTIEYLPLDTEMMHRAAELWAEARSRGAPTTTDQALDGDVILAAQAMSVSGTIITANRRHLSQFVPAKEWSDLTL
jgi:predicted nucleic acid-binding protein